ncbi:MAG: hypothetical protein Ct9H300mP19_11080 [Dehalococcoidia bacterium]|nr:MAG: hypothetical protein Ct9H300mP19_11080 [Dehalococcoidia bacterium]
MGGTRKHGVARRINRIDFLGMSWGVGVQKTGLSLLGYEGTMPRKPNLPLSDTQISEVKDALIEARILNFDGTPAHKYRNWSNGCKIFDR